MGNCVTKIALGKDIILRYTARSDDIIEHLHELAIEVHICDYNGNAYVAPSNVEGNTIIARYDGRAQKMLGNYDVRIWFNKGKEGQFMIDFANPFELIKTTEEESEEAEISVTTVILNIEESGQGGGGQDEPQEGEYIRYRGEVDEVPENFTTAIMALTRETATSRSLENERVSANKYYLYAVKTDTPITFEIYNAGGGQITGFERGSVTINSEVYSYAIIPASTMSWRFNIYPINN